MPLPAPRGHEETTPSFTINPSKNLWKCFRCDTGGVIDLHAQLRGLSIGEAMRESLGLVANDLEGDQDVAWDKGTGVKPLLTLYLDDMFAGTGSKCHDRKGYVLSANTRKASTISDVHVIRIPALIV